MYIKTLNYNKNDFAESKCDRAINAKNRAETLQKAQKAALITGIALAALAGIAIVAALCVGGGVPFFGALLLTGAVLGGVAIVALVIERIIRFCKKSKEDEFAMTDFRKTLHSSDSVEQQKWLLLNLMNPEQIRHVLNDPKLKDNEELVRVLAQHPGGSAVIRETTILVENLKACNLDLDKIIPEELRNVVDDPVDLYHSCNGTESMDGVYDDE